MNSMASDALDALTFDCRHQNKKGNVRRLVKSLYSESSCELELILKVGKQHEQMLQGTLCILISGQRTVLGAVGSLVVGVPKRQRQKVESNIKSLNASLTALSSGLSPVSFGRMSSTFCDKCTQTSLSALRT